MLCGLIRHKQARSPVMNKATGGEHRYWRSWLPLIAKPLRRGIVIFALVLIVEYLVVPELIGASKDL